MEDGLEEDTKYLLITRKGVLILVLVEDGLEVRRGCQGPPIRWVLILVLVEDGLEVSDPLSVGDILTMS